MCFNTDYDWHPSVYDETRQKVPESDFPVRCEECRCLIHPGETARFIWMQENDPDEWDEAVEAGDFDPGESFECVICSECQKLLDAIMAAEIEEGCHHNEAQPGFGQLAESLWDNWRDDGRYWDRALLMFPELKSHLWRLMPVVFDDLREHERWSSRDLEPVEVYGGEA